MDSGKVEALTEVLAAFGMPAAWALTAVRSLLDGLGWFGAPGVSWTIALIVAALAARIVTTPLWMVAGTGRRNELVSWPIRCGIRTAERFSSRAIEAERVRLERYRPTRRGFRFADRAVVTGFTVSLALLLTALYLGARGTGLSAVVDEPDSPVALTSAGWQLVNGDGSAVRIALGGIACGLIWWLAVSWQDKQTRTQALPAWVLRWDPARRRPALSLAVALVATLVVLPFGASVFIAVWELLGCMLLPALLRPVGPPAEFTERYLQYDETDGRLRLRPSPRLSPPTMDDLRAAAPDYEPDFPTEEIPVIDAPLAADPPHLQANSSDSPLRSAPPTSPLSTDDPRRIGGYELYERLGAGGMGTVYVARDPWTNTDVALKTVAASVLGAQKDLIRFQREADTLAMIDNAFTVKILGSGIDRQRPYMVMELLDGMTLDDFVYEVGPITDPEILHALGLALALSLAGLHRSFLVHRDIKPSNLMLTSTGPKLIDFGIVHMRNATRLTRTGTHLGTMAYMAPEQFRGANVSPAADVWAWGCCLVIAATGHGPFDAPDIASITRKILMDEPDPELLDYLDKLDGPFARIIRSTLDKDPSVRPSDGMDLLSKLWPRGVDIPAITTYVQRVWRKL